MSIHYGRLLLKLIERCALDREAQENDDEQEVSGNQSEMFDQQSREMRKLEERGKLMMMNIRYDEVRREV